MSGEAKWIRSRLDDNPTGRWLIVVTVGLMALGVVMVHSALASVAETGAWRDRADVRQTGFAALALIGLVVLWRLDFRWLARRTFKGVPVWAGLGLLVALVLSAAVLHPAIGTQIHGARRWLRVGPVSFQPSELLKIALVVFLAAWLTRPTAKPERIRTFLVAAAVVGLSAALIVTQDFGTATILCIGAGVTLMLSGVRWWHVMSLLPLAALGFWVFVVDEPRRWARIQAMLDPWSLENPSSYQPRQSLLAILNGGWLGKGIGGGVQKLGYLPEDDTDFIFSVYCEEFGFVGALLLMGLIGLWTWHAFAAARKAPTRFGRALAGSLGFLISMQMIMHIAVDVGVLPPTGIALPFVSRGGTSLLTMAAATAMIVSVSAWRPAEETRPALAADVDDDWADDSRPQIAGAEAPAA